MSDGVQRLHLCVIGVVAAVLGLDDGGCIAERLRGVALSEPVGCHGHAEITGGRCEGFDAFIAVKAPSLARAAPGDAALDRGLASESSPRSFCQHTNAVRQAYGRNHARNRADLRLVKLLWHGALCRSIE